MNTPNDHPTPGVPHLHDLLYDAHVDRVGEFRGRSGPYWILRPACGGAAWEAKPEDVRPATQAERLSASIATANARTRNRGSLT